jgi:hypothetical protein
LVKVAAGGAVVAEKAAVAPPAMSRTAAAAVARGAERWAMTASKRSAYEPSSAFADEDLPTYGHG